MNERQTIKSDGGSTGYYNIPKWAEDIGDLIHYKQMGFNVGNIFKACFRLDDKEGTDRRYDLNKMIFFAQRELEYLDGRGKGTTQNPTDQSHSERSKDS